MPACIRFLALIAGLFLTIGAAAKPTIIPAAPRVAATSYLLIDADTSKVIAERNSREPVPPASLTKVMTAFVAEEELKAGRIALADEAPVSVKAWRTQGSRMFIREGTTVSVEDLLRGIIITSGNDASVALAEYIADSEEAFAGMMNQRAQELGMANSNFLNSTGLPMKGHETTAWDLALLTREYILRFPESYAMYAEKSFTYNNIKQPNRNRLIWRDRSVDGVKTGYTQEAGYCLLASSVRDGMRLISVVMGTGSDAARVRESQKLLSYGFRFFETKRLYEPGPPLKVAEVWYGESDMVELGVAEPVVITFPRGAYDEVVVQITLAEVIEAPIKAGDEYGKLHVRLGEEELQVVPLVALSSISEAGALARFWDFITLSFSRMFG